MATPTKSSEAGTSVIKSPRPQRAATLKKHTPYTPPSAKKRPLATTAVAEGEPTQRGAKDAEGDSQDEESSEEEKLTKGSTKSKKGAKEKSTERSAGEESSDEKKETKGKKGKKGAKKKSTERSDDEEDSADDNKKEKVSTKNKKDTKKKSSKQSEGEEESDDMKEKKKPSGKKAGKKKDKESGDDGDSSDAKGDKNPKRKKRGNKKGKKVVGASDESAKESSEADDAKVSAQPKRKKAGRKMQHKSDDEGKGTNTDDISSQEGSEESSENEDEKSKSSKNKKPAAKKGKEGAKDNDFDKPVKPKAKANTAAIPSFSPQTNFSMPPVVDLTVDLPTKGIKKSPLPALRILPSTPSKMRQTRSTQRSQQEIDEAMEKAEQMEHDVYSDIIARLDPKLMWIKKEDLASSILVRDWKKSAVIKLRKLIQTMGYKQDSTLLVIAYYAKGNKAKQIVKYIILDGNTRAAAVADIPEVKELPCRVIMLEQGSSLPFDIMLKIGKAQNHFNDVGTRGSSVVDDLVTLHTLLDEERKLTPKQRTALEQFGYQGPYLLQNQPQWPNLIATTYMAGDRLKKLFTIEKVLSPDNLQMLRNYAMNREEGVEDPWSVVKLQARVFLNAPDEVMSQAIVAVESGEITSEASMNMFCVNKIVGPLLDDARKKYRLKENDVTKEMRDSVYSYFCDPMKIQLHKTKMEKEIDTQIQEHLKLLKKAHTKKEERIEAGEESDKEETEEQTSPTKTKGKSQRGKRGANKGTTKADKDTSETPKRGSPKQDTAAKTPSKGGKKNKLEFVIAKDKNNNVTIGEWSMDDWGSCIYLLRELFAQTTSVMRLTNGTVSKFFRPGFTYNTIFYETRFDASIKQPTVPLFNKLYRLATDAVSGITLIVIAHSVNELVYMLNICRESKWHVNSHLVIGPKSLKARQTVDKEGATVSAPVKAAYYIIVASDEGQLPCFTPEATQENLSYACSNFIQVPFLSDKHMARNKKELVFPEQPPLQLYVSLFQRFVKPESRVLSFNCNVGGTAYAAMLHKCLWTGQEPNQIYAQAMIDYVPAALADAAGDCDFYDHALTDAKLNIIQFDWDDDDLLDDISRKGARPLLVHYVLDSKTNRTRFDWPSTVAKLIERSESDNVQLEDDSAASEVDEVPDSQESSTTPDRSAAKHKRQPAYDDHESQKKRRPNDSDDDSDGTGDGEGDGDGRSKSHHRDSQRSSQRSSQSSPKPSGTVSKTKSSQQPSQSSKNTKQKGTNRRVSEPSVIVDDDLYYSMDNGYETDSSLEFDGEVIPSSVPSRSPYERQTPTLKRRPAYPTSPPISPTQLVYRDELQDRKHHTAKHSHAAVKVTTPPPPTPTTTISSPLTISLPQTQTVVPPLATVPLTPLQTPMPSPNSIDSMPSIPQLFSTPLTFASPFMIPMPTFSPILPIAPPMFQLLHPFAYLPPFFPPFIPSVPVCYASEGQLGPQLPKTSVIIEELN